jgi:hypothetical protein
VRVTTSDFIERLNVRKVITFFGILFLLAGGAKSHGRPEAASHAASEEDIREAVLRYQMEDWIRTVDRDEAEAKNQADKEAAQHYNFKIFFVEISGKDPTDDLMKRLATVPRIVKKASDSETRKTLGMPVVNRDTQERGIIFSADDIRWLGKNRVKVEGGYHCDGLCGADYTFDVRFEKGRWIVRKARMNWIS